MSAAEILKSTKTKDLFCKLYGNDTKIIEAQQNRFESLLHAFENRFKSPALRLFSSPGRTEIGGNHTDHNLGKVLAASIRLDCIAAVSPTTDGKITLFDLTYAEDYVLDTAHTTRITNEKGSIALVRGMIQGFKNAGYKVGGFNAALTSDVIAAAGVSSSASFEMLICCILSNLYNNERIPVQEFAAIGQFAENNYWDKASGLLDQTSCAVGGLIAIDFKNPKSPKVEKINFDFEKQNYAAIIVNTGKSHADLSEEYSSIPNEMRSVAQFLGKQNLREISLEQLIHQLPQIRAACGDRAVMRAFHFFAESERADLQVAALKQNNFNEFLRLVKESGNSSWKWLQNTVITGEKKEQSIPVCLALTELFINKHCSEKRPGACRVHGGGFAGVMQVFLPLESASEYTDYMHTALGVKEKSPIYVMTIRPLGVIEIC